MLEHRSGAGLAAAIPPRQTAHFSRTYDMYTGD